MSMHRKNLSHKGTILFDHGDHDLHNTNIAAFVNSLDLKMREKAEIKKRQYNFDFESGTPCNMSDDACSDYSFSSCAASSYVWKPMK